MKLFYAVIIIDIIIILSSIGGYYYLVNFYADFSELLIHLENNVRENDWQQSKNINKQLQKKWNDSQKIVPFLKDQGELHDFDLTLSRISSLIKYREKKELLPEILLARRLANNILEQEKLAIKNIF